VPQLPLQRNLFEERRGLIEKRRRSKEAAIKGDVLNHNQV
jgi:hypothetical protein